MASSAVASRRQDFSPHWKGPTALFSLWPFEFFSISSCGSFLQSSFISSFEYQIILVDFPSHSFNIYFEFFNSRSCSFLLSFSSCCLSRASQSQTWALSSAKTSAAPSACASLCPIDQFIRTSAADVEFSREHGESKTPKIVVEMNTAG